MARNIGYLTSSSNKESDETYTPKYAVKPIVKYLLNRGYRKIWCPFDQKHSKYVEVLEELKFNVQYSHIKNGQDFFKYCPPQDYDCIVSNAPFSIKDLCLKRCYELNKPFALLLPQNSLQSIFRTDLFIKYGLEYLGFDKRISFYTRDNMEILSMNNCFASGYFCKDVLPEKLIFEKLELEQEPYFDL
jgi:hypothetical protein